MIADCCVIIGEAIGGARRSMLAPLQFEQGAAPYWGQPEFVIIPLLIIIVAITACFPGLFPTLLVKPMGDSLRKGQVLPRS